MTKVTNDPLDALAAQASALDTEADAAAPGAEQAQAAPPPITNEQAFAGAVGAAREAFCFFTHLKSPRLVLDDDTVAQLGQLWGPVLTKHGIDAAAVMGDWALELTAGIATFAIVAKLRSAVNAELAELKAQAKAKADAAAPDTVDMEADGHTQG